MATTYIPQNPIPDVLRERLERFVRGTTVKQLHEMFRGVDPAAVARATAGMRVSAETRRKIEYLLPRLEGEQP